MLPHGVKMGALIMIKLTQDLMVVTGIPVMKVFADGMTLMTSSQLETAAILAQTNMKRQPTALMLREWIELIEHANSTKHTGPHAVSSTSKQMILREQLLLMQTMPAALAIPQQMMDGFQAGFDPTE